jgi:diacylglycerol kinase family enzyme
LGVAGLLISTGVLIYQTRQEEVGFLRSNRFKITTTLPQKVVLDGEIIGMNPIDVECIPGGLTIFAPQIEELQSLERLDGLPNLKIEIKT